MSIKFKTTLAKKKLVNNRCLYWNLKKRRKVNNEIYRPAIWQINYIIWHRKLT